MLARSLSRLIPAVLCLACCSRSVQAQEWATRMFDRTEVKFGSVARLADTTFKIKVHNPFVEDIQITGLSTSCGCISWIDKPVITLKSREEREITIRLDTIGHVGDKRVRAYVSLYEPTRRLSASVTIPVEGRIRSDFEVRPSHVGFGAIDLGKSYTQRIGINYIGGRPDWKILKGTVSNKHLSVEVHERSRNGGTATYEAIVLIDAAAPAGTLRDQLILTTNEAGDSTIAIPVEARVEADIVVTDVQFGTVSPGQAKSMTVVVRGKKPFKIEQVSPIVKVAAARPAEDGTGTPADQPSVADAIAVKLPPNAAAVQVLTVTLDPPAASGLFEEDFAITIADRPAPVHFKVRGRIQSTAAGN